MPKRIVNFLKDNWDYILLPFSFIFIGIIYYSLEFVLEFVGWFYGHIILFLINLFSK